MVLFPNIFYFFGIAALCTVDTSMIWFSEIWSDKLKVLYYKAHGVTERTEVTQCHGGADGTKSDGGVAYRFLINTLR